MLRYFTQQLWIIPDPVDQILFSHFIEIAGTLTILGGDQFYAINTCRFLAKQGGRARDFFYI